MNAKAAENINAPRQPLNGIERWGICVGDISPRLSRFNYTAGGTYGGLHGAGE
jgi:hypothetical protein